MPSTTNRPRFDELPPAIAPAQAASSASVWIIAGAFIGVALVLLAIGLVQFMDSTTPPQDDLAATPRPIAAMDRPDSVAPDQRLAVVAAVEPPVES